ncbi:hypothetical protein ACQ86N_21555 [Puia sp. P3]
MRKGEQRTFHRIALVGFAGRDLRGQVADIYASQLAVDGVFIAVSQCG